MYLKRRGLEMGGLLVLLLLWSCLLSAVDGTLTFFCLFVHNMDPLGTRSVELTGMNQKKNTVS